MADLRLACANVGGSGGGESLVQGAGLPAGRRVCVLSDVQCFYCHRHGIIDVVYITKNTALIVTAMAILYIGATMLYVGAALPLSPHVLWGKRCTMWYV